MAKSPFPGMDPYLENPEVWSDLHDTINTIFREQLIPKLVPKYIAELQTEIIIDQIEKNGNGDDDHGGSLIIPDVAVILPQDRKGRGQTGVMVAEPMTAAPLRLRIADMVERRLTHVRILRQSDYKLVAVIELLSPVNKRPGDKREVYLKKRRKYIESSVHLIEIDLLRRWPRMPFAEELPACDYLIVVSNAQERPDADVWPVSVRQPLPTIPIPLLRPDPPVTLDIGDALRTAYERARYDLRIDYNKPAKPPLSSETAQWATELIAQQQVAS